MTDERIEQMFCDGKSAAANDCEHGWKHPSVCPHPHDSTDRHWWTRGYAHQARLLQRIEAQAEVARLREETSQYHLARNGAERIAQQEAYRARRESERADNAERERDQLRAALAERDARLAMVSGYHVEYAPGKVARICDTWGRPDLFGWLLDVDGKAIWMHSHDEAFAYLRLNYGYHADAAKPGGSDRG